ncbi:MAG: hypothetical protein LBJ93_03065 [Clostridiales bacterium]|nr:hypothetical protein [Clostridiales bacterium]
MFLLFLFFKNIVLIKKKKNKLFEIDGFDINIITNNKNHAAIKLNNFIKKNKNIKILKSNLRFKGSNLIFADGIFLSSFFVHRVLKDNILDLQTKEIFLLDGNNTKLTQIALENIYPKVNYLTLMTENKNIYEKQVHEIFCDSGLNIQIVGFNKYLLNNADITINFNDKFNFCYSIKKNSLIINLLINNLMISNLKNKRPDLKIIDNINFIYKNKKIKCDLAEIILFNKYKDFEKLFLHKKFDKNLFYKIKEKINKELDLILQ